MIYIYAQALISFREGFEAAILVAIISSYLRKIGEDRLVPPLIIGSMGGVLLSMLTGILIYSFYTTAQVGELIEASSSFIAVLVLTSVIYWMNKKGGRIKQEIEMKTKEAVERKSVLPIAILGFIVVFREGVETVLFTLPLIFAEPWSTFIGVFSGILFSVVLAYLVFKGGMKLSLKKFFQLTSLLLIFVASGILGYGVHELIEYGEEKG